MPDETTDVTFPDSLWRATAIPNVDRPALTGEHHVDICVIGAGYTGLSAALHARAAGAATVVLEAQDVGWGASGRNGGQVIAGVKWDPDDIVAHYGDDLGERMVEFVDGTAGLVFALIEEHRIDCHAERSGWISALHGPAARRALEARARQWQARGADVVWLDQDEMRRRIGSRAYAAGLLDRRGGKLQPLSYARGLARAAEQRGVEIFVRTAAKRVGRAAGGWRVLTEHGSVTAGQILLCANAYTDGLWPGLARSVIPAFSYQVATEPLGDNVRRSILSEGQVVSDTRRLLRYFRLDHTGRLLMGGRGRNVDSHNPRHYRQVVRYVRETFPDLADVKLAHYWGGRVALTIDHMPHLHELAPGIYTALGYNGRGVAMATALGKLLAARAGGLPEADVPFPLSQPSRVPFHRLRRPIISLAGWWRRLADASEVRGGDGS
jgi:glycine/D-amino acid oxidase-like deaminating enzyme